MKFVPARIAIISALALLTACGGGGGNPGECHGGDEVCGRTTGTGNTSVPATVTPTAPTTGTTTGPLG